jgi:ubiquinone/menaquinone biosynthesis C-methylase UbiE
LKHSLLEYLPFVGERPIRGANKYVGSVAANYDATRVNEPKWTVEQSIIEGWIDQMPEGSTVLDAPIGTGRFLHAYARRKLNVHGLDRSRDMLREAERKLPSGFDIKLHVGDVRDTQLPDKCVDAALNIRITRWLTPRECQQMMREMQRVSRSAIIWTARVANHKHARSREVFEQALDGWKITRDVAGYVADYRIMVAEPNA